MTPHPYLPPVKGKNLDIITGRYHDIGLLSYDTNALTLRSATLSGTDISASCGRPIEISPDITGPLRVWTGTPHTVRPESALYCGEFKPWWGHFIAFHLQRLWWLLSAPKSEWPDRVVFHVDSPDLIRPLSGNVAAIAETLGIADRIDLIYEPQCFAKVIVPEAACNFDEDVCTYSATYASMMQEIGRRAMGNVEPAKPFRRIFMTRSQLPEAPRKDYGINDLDHLFAANGFEVVAPESLSLSRMAALLAEAEIVVTTSGTIAHNVMFAPAGTQHVILERAALNNPIQAGLDMARQGETVHVEASYSPHTIQGGAGPFLYALTPWLDRWLRDHDMLPTAEMRSHRRLLRHLRGYLRTCRRLYGYSQVSDDYADIDASSQAEAFRIALASPLGPYLSGRRILFAADILDPHMLWRTLKNRR